MSNFVSFTDSKKRIWHIRKHQDIDAARWRTMTTLLMLCAGIENATQWLRFSAYPTPITRLEIFRERLGLYPIPDKQLLKSLTMKDLLEIEKLSFIANMEMSPDELAEIVIAEAVKKNG